MSIQRSPSDSEVEALDDATSQSLRHRLSQHWRTFRSLGQLPLIVVAQFLRNCARMLNTTSSYEKKTNLRILIITDYTPPQTHGIAIRFSHYITHMRQAGHEVQVYSTNLHRQRLTSFDHPNMPAIINPFNTSNCMAYNPGLRLAWACEAGPSPRVGLRSVEAEDAACMALGAKQWDIVHLVYPSIIGPAIVPVCNWRRIPVYCSHHVDMEYYIEQYAASISWLGNLSYWLFCKLPAARHASVNAAPTLCFLDSHVPHKAPGCMRMRIPSGVADARFKVDSAEQLVAERRDLERLCGAAAGDAICLMVQRDGPARRELAAFAERHALPVTFTGNVKNDRLPPLYRAADAFVTCSTSETYGLTVLEALACGTPAVLPHCSVFDELWEARLPAEWMYNHGEAAGLLSSLAAAVTPGSKQRLREEPVKANLGGSRRISADLGGFGGILGNLGESMVTQASWRDATTELIAQYEKAIEANLPHRMELATIGAVVTNLMRVALVGLLIWWALRIEGRVAMATAIALLRQFSEDPTSISR
ncbi:hypothetical protein EMIHUDRAFT_453232 [Emiliania huxleyi CCMP1516]|uniref:Glycosyl transferase family 1 domain-containing protein n=2 Tax=Emiliania huxleyi TaxID=2903 RepID=A0A0D3I9N1_EMIH1|nr:hypothetical protein EMIHUDRAFT_453232 [Emiliania huxleyi CCMP1516]EOD07966.1 hypothetical protein EMIHUDRAFT_453232 [Emiliania huxleyi CCMP1516]|eukprot:XP_005760395.1 hypothetical protein EMIHUDRAFT_453232 [Emiliania huxleyi CCMP1516]